MYSSSTSKKQKIQSSLKAGFSSEFDNKTDQQPQPPLIQKIVNHKIGGILSLGQTIEFSAGLPTAEKQNQFLAESLYSLQKQEKILLDSRQKELKQTIDQLRSEIKALAKANKDLDQQVKKAAFEAETAPQPSQYQISFLQRIHQFIHNFRLNISQASVWVEALTSKKKKRNAFWRKFKSSGQQYLFSGEHSASRSAA